jgi:CrcB protein
VLFLASIVLAGGLGSLARYGISNAFHGDMLPWATLAINVLGSFLLGVLVVLPADWLSVQSRDVLGVGLLGGFTTFSTFSVQAILEVDAGEPGRAGAYVVASVLGGLAAATAGYVLGRKLA